MTKQINIKYIFEEDYNPVYCNGAYGGIGPQGELIANFYLERMPIPRKVIMALDEEGHLADTLEIIPRETESAIVRYVSSGIVLNQKDAKSMYIWLGDMLAKMEQPK